MNNPSFFITNRLILFVLISAIITIPLAVAQEGVIEGLPYDKGLCGPLTIDVNGTCVPDYETVCSPGTAVVDGICHGDEPPYVHKGNLASKTKIYQRPHYGEEPPIIYRDCLIATAYLAQELRPEHQKSNTNVNACTTTAKYVTATHDWILGIKVESPGSYYWD